MRISRAAARIMLSIFSRPNYLGILSGTIWFCFSLTPSLLPRPWLLQAVVTGVSFAAGYGLGVWASWTLRKLVRREPPARYKAYAWTAMLALAAGGAGTTMTFYFTRWQNEVRALVDEPPLESAHRILIFVIAAAVASLCILLSRSLFRLIQQTDKWLARWIPRRFSGALAALCVGVFLYLALNGVIYSGFVRFANNTYRSANNTTPAGITKPSSPYRSGSPASAASWESLGRQGRRFTGGGPSPAQLKTFSGRQPQEPIRVYAGLESAHDTKARVALAIKELERTGAFDRAVLVVAAPTGTGWVNPQTADSLEYMWNGDSAIVAVQYSYLPSWISFMVDKENATSTGRELFNQVYEKWRTLPAGGRPKLIAYGLSLGSYGIQAAFSGEDDLKNRTDGALFVGTPNDTLLWQDIRKNRDPGSPVWLPTYNNGRTIRFASMPSDFARPAGSAWAYPRVAYLQHASDPIVWWSPEILFQQPSWLREPPGTDVSPAVAWFPIATFLHVTVDQFVGGAAPDNHGHTYATAPVDALAAIVPPPGWDAMKTSRLRAIIATYTDR